MIIDLSVSLKEGMPIYPGDQKLEITDDGTFAAEGYMGHSVMLGTHTGTHLDAPAHMIKGGKTLDKFPADRFVGRGSYVFVKDNIFSLKDVQEANIQEGDVVVFNTRMSYRYYDPVYFEDYPAMDEDIAHFLIERKVKMVGVDTCSVDNQPDFPIHKLLLASDILIIENLTNVEQLAEMESTIFALPLRLDLDGAPARVVAEVR